MLCPPTKEGELPNVNGGELNDDDDDCAGAAAAAAAAAAAEKSDDDVDDQVRGDENLSQFHSSRSTRGSWRANTTIVTSVGPPRMPCIQVETGSYIKRESFFVLPARIMRTRVANNVVQAKVGESFLYVEPCQHQQEALGVDPEERPSDGSRTGGRLQDDRRQVAFALGLTSQSWRGSLLGPGDRHGRAVVPLQIDHLVR